MSNRTLVSRVSLLAKTYAQWALIEEAFKPNLGEVCYYVDSSTNVVRSKVGNGVNYLADLPFADAYVDEKIDTIDESPRIYTLDQYTGGQVPANLFAVLVSEVNVGDWEDVIELDGLEDPYNGPYISKEEDLISGLFYVTVDSSTTGSVTFAYGQRNFEIVTDERTGDKSVVFGDLESTSFVTTDRIIDDVEDIDDADKLPVGSVVKEYVDTAIAQADPAEKFVLDYDEETEKFILIEEDYERFEAAITAGKTIKFVFDESSIPLELVEVLDDEEEEHYIYKFTHNTAKVECVAVHYEEPTPDGHYLVIDLEAGEQVLWTSALPKIFEITLNKDSWEDNEQAVEHDNFFADGVLYSVEPKTNLDNVIATEAEIEAIEVNDGEMVFAYGGIAPSANVTFVIRAEFAEIEEPPTPPVPPTPPTPSEEFNAIVANYNPETGRFDGLDTDYYDQLESGTPVFMHFVMDEDHFDLPYEVTPSYKHNGSDFPCAYTGDDESGEIWTYYWE